MIIISRTKNLLILCCVTLSFAAINSITLLSNIPQSSKISLTSNVQDLTITSPENRTYTHPDYGYYPATIGFESDEIGSIPHGWTDLSGSSAFIDTYSSIGGHKNVMRLVDTGSYQSKVYSPTFAAQFFGTIEYWIYVEDATDGNFFTLDNNDGLNRAFLFAIMGDSWQYFGVSAWKVMDELPTPKDNTWYYVSVHFECSSSRYMGLEQYSVRFEVDGISSQDYLFENQLPYITDILFCTVTNHHETFYVDSIGYSWDPAYSIGDNLNEGLLLSYDSSISLAWIGYSLDNQMNNSINGNTVIRFPSLGSHSIQVFGNDSLGNIHESEITCFSIGGSSTNPFPQNPFNVDWIFLSVLMGIIGIASLMVILLLVYRRRMIKMIPKRESPIKTISEAVFTCPYCHTEIDPKSNYCPYCSSKING